MISTDLCIIGGGAGGLSLAAGAAQLGVKVTLIEKGAMGGDCLNSGCVPSKALLAAARRAYLAKSSAGMGVTANVTIDYDQVRAHIQAVIQQIAEHDSVARFEALGVRVIQASAEFLSPTHIKAGNAIIQAKYMVIATGSSPVIPPIPGLEGTPFLTNETVFQMEKLPQHLVIMGGGPIGIEMAQAYRRLGSAVTVVEGFSILSRDDQQAVQQLKNVLTSEGISLLEGHLVQHVSYQGGCFQLSCKTTKGEVSVSGDALLVAVGRKPNLEGLLLENADIAYTKRGIEVDKALRTSTKNIYALGDATGLMPFTHVANLHAGIILQRILFKLPVSFQAATVPWVTYTDPELAQVGPTETELEKQGIKYEVVHVPLATNDRALCEGESEGSLKLLLIGGKVKAVTMLAAHASDLMPLWLPVVGKKLTLRQISGLTFPYPSRGEWLKKAASVYLSPKLFSPFVKGLVQFLLKL